RPGPEGSHNRRAWLRGGEPQRGASPRSRHRIGRAGATSPGPERPTPSPAGVHRRPHGPRGWEGPGSTGTPVLLLVAEQGHHAALGVVDVVAVDHPPPGVVRVEV